MEKHKRQNDGADVLQHDQVKLFARKLEIVLSHFIDDDAGLCSPANHEASGEGHDRHGHIVADKVHDVENLAGTPLGSPASK